MRGLKIVYIILGIFFLIGINFWYLATLRNEKMILGASFSPEYTRYLGLDTKKTYKVILDDWNFRYLRLTARWDEIEKERGKFDFSELDYLMGEAAKRNVKVVLALGQKTPRWPECNVPVWSEKLSDDEYFLALNNFLKNTTQHFSNHPALEIWQVENEPFLAFGKVCHKLDSVKLKTEIDAVKNLDKNHPVLVTDSGELSMWGKTIKAGDLFGTTIYRIVWNEHLGYFAYNWLPASAYRLRALWHGRDLNQTYVAELQAEPWVANHTISDNNVAEQFKTMNLDRLKKNLYFAKQTGFSRAYLWGIEWWYWLKVHGYPDIYDYAKNLAK